MSVLHLRRAKVVPPSSPADAGALPQQLTGDVVVLSGGGALGAWQVGAVRALVESGVRPTAFVGCSVGALNAAFLGARELTVDRCEELAEVWRGLKREDVFAGGRSGIARHLVRGDSHLYDEAALDRLVARLIGDVDLADGVVPVHVVTTDLVSGQPVWWSKGPARRILCASACLPGIFPPVHLGGSLHVDGGVTCPVPVGHGLSLGAARTWVLDVTGGSLGRLDERMTALDVLLASFAVSRGRLVDQVLPAAGQTMTVLHRDDDVRIDLRDFTRTRDLMRAGYETAEKMIDRPVALAG